MRGATACWDCAGYRKHSEPPRAGGPGMSGVIFFRAQAESEGAAVKRWRETASMTVATERASRE